MITCIAPKANQIQDFWVKKYLESLNDCSNNDILKMGKHLRKYTNNKPTFEQYYHLLLVKWTLPIWYMLVPSSSAVK